MRRAKAVFDTRRRVHLPSRLLQYMNPWALALWTTSSIYDMACALAQAIDSGKVQDYKKAIIQAKRLRGVGQYGSEHMLRTAFLMANMPHPSRKFAIMGTGANKETYEVLTSHGIHTMNDLDKAMGSYGLPQLDAGELAYALCSLHVCSS